MNLNKFTVKAQESLAKAQSTALEYGQQAIENAHILHGMLQEDSELMGFLIGKVGANPKRIEEANLAHIKSLPKVEGGQVYLSQNANNTLVQAEKAMRSFDDQFITNEHLLLALLDAKDSTGSLLKDAGLRRSDLEKAIREVRGGQKVSSETHE